MFALEQYIYTNFRLILYSWCFQRSELKGRFESITILKFGDGSRFLSKASLSTNNFSKLVIDSDWPKEVSGQRWHHLFFCYAPLLWQSTLAKCLVHFNPSYIFEWPRPLGFFKLSLKLVGVARLYTSYRSNIESSCLVGLPQTRSWRQPPKWPP